MSNALEQDDLKISLEHSSSPDDVLFVEKGLASYNQQHVPEDGYQPLNIFLRNKEGDILGGLLGETYWGWLHVRILWIDSSARARGYGECLMKMAEDEAVRRGCSYAHLDTMSFQAQPFYEKLGYSVFGTLDNLPVGHQRIFMRKSLSKI